MSDDFWGEPIFSYTRKMAIDDGVLVDIDRSIYEGFGIKVPLCITQTLWVDLISDENDFNQNDKLRNFLMYLTMAMLKHNKEGRGDEQRFKFKIGPSRPIIVDIGPADDLSPCLTVGYSEDF